MAFISPQLPLTDQQGYPTKTWFGFFQDVLNKLTRSAGVNVFTLANQPTGKLGPQDAGYVGLVSDYGHMVRWTGTAWEFLPGDSGSGYLVEFAVAPQAPYWGLCDGSTYAYLVVGTTLTAVSFTPAIAANIYFRM